MFSSSTQKQYWSFGSQAELDELRATANKAHIARYQPLLEEQGRMEAINDFLTPEEEITFSRMVVEPGLRFGDEFQPPMWPSVRWIAFAYFKRFYLRQSTMEFFPRQLLMVSYWLATKVDEFNISIDSFVGNLKTGTPQSNVEMILTLEPEVMRRLDYHFIVHTPYRPFEGHLLDLKARALLPSPEVVETLRPHGMNFLTKALLGDAMFLFPPSQIALAAVKTALRQIQGEIQTEELLHEWLTQLCEVSDQTSHESTLLAARRVDALQLALDTICNTVERQAIAPSGDKERLKARVEAISRLQMELDPELKRREQEQQRQQKQEEFDSDDELLSTTGNNE